MRLSARNQLGGRVSSVANGEVMSSIRTLLRDGQTVTAVVSQESAEDLDLAAGDEVIVIVRSTDVMLAKPSVRTKSDN